MVWWFIPVERIYKPKKQGSVLESSVARTVYTKVRGKNITWLGNLRFESPVR